MKIMFQATLLAMALNLAGCIAVGPDYQPLAGKPVEQLQGFDTELQSTASFQAEWWRQFGDPILNALVQRAARNNLDLQMAVARLREARWLLSGTQADRLPAVDVAGTAQRSREQMAGLGSTPVSLDTYQLGFDAIWELDFFGGIRRSEEASKASLQASQASLRDAQVTVFAEVVRIYFELRGTQLRLDIARRDIGNQRDTLKLIRARSQIGSGSEQDVATAEARLSAVEAQIPRLETRSADAQRRLAVLLGARPGELDIDLSPKTFTPVATRLPIGGAGEVLVRRPDIRVAERELAAETARIGVSKADFFPHISLGGFVGFLSIKGAGSDGGYFGGPDSLAWSLGPSISWSGLNVQRASAKLHASEARTDAAMANFQQTVLRALEDVSDSLTAYNEERIRVGKLLEQSQQSKRAADLARVRYLEGATDFLELLDAERTQLAAEDDLAQAEVAINTDTVAIYKEIGGGWEACGDDSCSQVARGSRE
ncbi:efflux transporter outer membrane subunit [Paraburkholderia sp. BCC1885]|uniref:efflux transporter outer membrane subunit n=1 Tax=Paraburkholderia sp. BCC1885 TaxID=2562669 RepID=UPI0011822AB4|nr:efflux transporter outer membrane subunit [Paraburkholderia sp. BCC1885]